MICERYMRQVSLFGEGGQDRLFSSKAFIAGAGGLGSPVATYLALAGVGNIVICDCDNVEITNLNRQYLHSESDIGYFKADSAKTAIEILNPEVSVSVIKEAVTSKNAVEITKGCDIIIDCLDNFEARYALNLASLTSNIPLIHGAVSGWDGQAITLIPGKTPCISCIFPKSPPDEIFPIVGTTAGVIGSIQANEAVRYLSGLNPGLSGRLLLWDGKTGMAEYIDIPVDSDCPVCGENKQKQRDFYED